MAYDHSMVDLAVIEVQGARDLGDFVAKEVLGLRPVEGGVPEHTNEGVLKGVRGPIGGSRCCGGFASTVFKFVYGGNHFTLDYGWDMEAALRPGDTKRDILTVIEGEQTDGIPQELVHDLLRAICGYLGNGSEPGIEHELRIERHPRRRCDRKPGRVIREQRYRGVSEELVRDNIGLAGELPSIYTEAKADKFTFLNPVFEQKFTVHAPKA